NFILEDAIQLLGRGDEGVRLFGHEALAGVDAAPIDCNREKPGSLRRLDVKRGVTNVHSLTGVRTQALEREEQWLRVRLVPFRLVPADHRLEEVTERHPGEGELNGLPPLRG